MRSSLGRGVMFTYEPRYCNGKVDQGTFVVSHTGAGNYPGFTVHGEINARFYVEALNMLHVEQLAEANLAALRKTPGYGRAA